MKSTGARVLVLAVGLAAVADAFAAAQRTFVASTGSDSSLTCSVTAPCRGFNAAMLQTIAGGEIIVVDSAGYGVISVGKSVSIVAPTGVYAGISVFSGTDGVTVNAPGATVVLRGLSINGQGGRWGINLQSAARVRVENCVVSNMTQEGIRHTASGAEVAILDTIVRDNGDFGINVIADTSLLLDHVRVEHNANSGLGIVPVTAETRASISDSIFANNAAHGVIADGGPGHLYLQVERSILSHNAVYGLFATSSPPASIAATLTRNAVNRNGNDGVLFSGFASFGYLSDNAVNANANGINVQNAAYVTVSANTVASNNPFDIHCDSGGAVRSLGNNIAANTSVGGCYTIGPGQ